uniref:Retrotransposon gag domain-containing protein n=1 Tax=Tanacetum cinerariifolium TaxID=118510 RepID=A0A6L2JPZ8_TANCI|nr:hypothetical protein [Tanacetum cinerariifolium]
MADQRTMAELLRAPTEGTTNLRNEISNFQQRFDESFHDAWDRYKDLLRACPHHGFTELHQLDTFYNALNPTDQDCLNSVAGGNLLERRTQDVLTIIENKSKVLNQQTSAVTIAMTAILKQFQATSPPASVKVIEEICVTYSAAVNHNQSNLVYRPLEQSYQAPIQQNQVVPLSELEKVKRMNGANMKVMQTQINNVKNKLINKMENSIQASMSNQTNELKNMMASFFQMNTASTSGSGSLPSNTIANPKGKLKAITTRSGIVFYGPSVPIPPPFINPEEDEHVEDTLTDQDLAEYTIKVPPPLYAQAKRAKKDEVQIHKFWQMFKQLYISITLADALILIPKYQKMLKALLSNKEKLQELANTPLNENCSAVILKKLSEKLGDLGKFLIPCGFNELKCKPLADLAGIARDVFVSVGKFTFPTDFVTVDYESDPRVPFILERPFLWTARALIDIHGEEMILRDGDERLTLNMRHDTSSYSNQPQKESINLINVFNDSNEDFLVDLFSTNQPSGNPTFPSHLEITLPEVKDDIFDPEGGNILPEKLLDLDSTKNLHPPHHVNPLSGSTTSSSSLNQLLEEFTDELALITFPPKNDDLQFDIEFNLKEIENLLHHDPIKDIDSILKDSIDQSNLADLNDNLVDSMPEMFTDEHALNYHPFRYTMNMMMIFFEVDSDTENVYDDPFDSKGEKIKESKLLIDELDLPSDFLPFFEYDSFLPKDFSKVDALPSTNNEDKVFNPGILIQENIFEIITRVGQDKKLAISHVSLMLEDFDPPPYELSFFKEVLGDCGGAAGDGGSGGGGRGGAFGGGATRGGEWGGGSYRSGDEPFIIKQDPGKNSSQSPPQINHHCCYGCGDSLKDIFCQQCTCELCGKGAHYGYNCPLKVPVVSNPEPCHNQNIDELPQTLPSFDPKCYSEDGNSFTYDFTSNLVHESPNVFGPPLQPPTYSYEFCGNDAYYGHDCSLQASFTYDPETCYNQDFNFLQNFQIFQQYPCCTHCGGPHETCQCD